MLIWGTAHLLVLAWRNACFRARWLCPRPHLHASISLGGKMGKLKLTVVMRPTGHWTHQKARMRMTPAT